MNRLLRQFLVNLGYATMVLGLPLAFGVLNAYAIPLMGPVGVLVVAFGCIIAGVALHTILP
jgi:hypothetical protein